MQQQIQNLKEINKFLETQTYQYWIKKKWKVWRDE